MNRRLAPTKCLAVAAIVLGCGACRGLDARLAQHQTALESLGATTKAVGKAWLDGHVSGTYTGTALEQVYLLVEQERASLAAAPQALLDPRGARLSQQAELLSRLLAQTLHDIRAADAAAVRGRLDAIPIAPPEPR